MSHPTETGEYAEWVPRHIGGNTAGGTQINDASINITFGEKLKSWLMAVAFVTSIAGNGYLALQLHQEANKNAQDIATALRKDAIAIDLNTNDFTFFKQNDWARMQKDVEVTKELIAAKCGK